MALRALTDAEERELEHLRARNLADYKAGKYKDARESVAALEAQTAHVGTPIPGAFVAKAVQEHGHLGLAALNVAAEWTLARPQPAGPRRLSPLSCRQPRSRRHRPTRRARSPGRRTSADDGDPEPELAVIPISAFRVEVDALLGERA